MADPGTRVSATDRIHGSLLGGALGDAFGAPVEFMRSREEIEAKFGPRGLKKLAPAYGRVGAITDDTQMTLFTAEGLLRGWVRFGLRGIGPAFPMTILYAYHRWLDTQLVSGPVAGRHDGWLITNRELFSCRAPGNTCLSALRESRQHPPTPAENDSKGCGGVMRVAPIGLFMPMVCADGQRACDHAYELGCAAAGWSHGHPTGQIAAGAFAAIIAGIMFGKDLREAISDCRDRLQGKADAAETLAAIEQAEALAEDGKPDHAKLVTLGEGWIAEEALAMSLYTALTASNFRSALVLAVNHGGDSDSTGAITGNLLGALWGRAALPKHWLAQLELREVIEQIATDLSEAPSWQISDWNITPEMGAFTERYPGN